MDKLIKAGADMAKLGRDRNIVVIAQPKSSVRAGQLIIIDELASFVWPKWYRQPLVAYRFWKVRQHYIRRGNLRGILRYRWLKARGRTTPNGIYWKNK